MSFVFPSVTIMRDPDNIALYITVVFPDGKNVYFSGADATQIQELALSEGKTTEEFICQKLVIVNDNGLELLLPYSLTTRIRIRLNACISNFLRVFSRRVPHPRNRTKRKLNWMAHFRRRKI